LDPLVELDEVEDRGKRLSAVALIGGRARHFSSLFLSGDAKPGWRTCLNTDKPTIPLRGDLAAYI
jgi:hypothetical protein